MLMRQRTPWRLGNDPWDLVKPPAAPSESYECSLRRLHATPWAVRWGEANEGALPVPENAPPRRQGGRARASQTRDLATLQESHPRVVGVQGYPEITLKLD